MIVDARGGDVGVAEPFLHLGDVGLVIERVGGGGRAQRVRADQEPQFSGIAAHQAIDPVGRDRGFEPSGAVVADRPEQCAGLVETVPGGVEIVVDQTVRARVQRHVARLTAFAGHLQVRHAFARMAKILDLQLAQFFAPQRMEQQGREDGAVTPALDGVRFGRVEQFARLVVADRRRLAFAAFGSRPLHPFDRIVGDGVLLAKVFEQRGHRGEPMADRRAAEIASAQLVAPGDQMRAGHDAEFLRPLDAGEAHEVLHGGLIGAAGVRVAEVREPLDLRRHVGEVLELGGRQQPVGGRDRCRKLVGRGGVVHGSPAGDVTLDKIRWTNPLRGSRVAAPVRDRRGPAGCSPTSAFQRGSYLHQVGLLAAFPSDRGASHECPSTTHD